MKIKMGIPDYNETQIWCDCCDDYIERSELQFKNNDDRRGRRKVCPDCGETLIFLPTVQDSDDEI